LTDTEGMSTDAAIRAFDLVGGDRASFVYSGSFPDDHTARLIALGEAFMEGRGHRRDFRNRLSFVMVEAYQNIIRHRARDLGAPDHGARSMFLLRCAGNSIQVAAVNPVGHDESGSLASMLGDLEGLDRGQLKELFLRGLQSQGLTRRGGAGLGLIEMARRSGNDLKHDLRELTPASDLFTLSIELGEEDPTKPEALQLAAELHQLITSAGIIVAHSGRIGSAAEEVVLRLLERESDVEATVVTRAYLAAMEHLHSLPPAHKGPLVMVRQEGRDRSLVLAQLLDPDQAITMGGTLAELTRMDPSAVSKRYREALLKGTTGGDHRPMGLLDLVPSRARADRHGMTPTSQGQMLAVVSVPL
jgi:hypothetical protein